MASPRLRSVVTAGAGGRGQRHWGCWGLLSSVPKPDLLGSGLMGADYTMHVLSCSVVSDSLQSHGL